MHEIEYRIEHIALQDGRPETEQIVSRLNELGRDGWHVTSIDLAGHPHWSTRSVPVLLERGMPVSGSAARDLAGAARG